MSRFESKISPWVTGWFESMCSELVWAVSWICQITGKCTWIVIRTDSFPGEATWFASWINVYSYRTSRHSNRFSFTKRHLGKNKVKPISNMCFTHVRNWFGFIWRELLWVDSESCLFLPSHELNRSSSWKNPSSHELNSFSFSNPLLSNEVN